MKEITLTKGLIAIVDDDDHEWLSKTKWHSYAAGYAASWVNKEHVYMHRLIVGLDKCAGLHVDHINLNKLDNRKENLRICTDSQNKQNRKIQENNTSGYKGVHWDANRCKWMARIKIGKKHIYLGRYDDKEIAYAAYCKAANEMHKEFARLE